VADLADLVAVAVVGGGADNVAQLLLGNHGAPLSVMSSINGRPQAGDGPTAVRRTPYLLRDGLPLRRKPSPSGEGPNVFDCSVVNQRAGPSEGGLAAQTPADSPR
jgi:hypothetical protein